MRRFLILLTSLAILALSPTAVLAKKKKRRVAYSNEFVIPFTCGSNPADLTSAVPGDYAIGIDVLGAGVDATVAAKVHFTYPPGGQMPAFTSDTIMLTVGGGVAKTNPDDLRAGPVGTDDPKPPSCIHHSQCHRCGRGLGSRNRPSRSLASRGDAGPRRSSGDRLPCPAW